MVVAGLVKQNVLEIASKLHCVLLYGEHDCCCWASVEPEVWKGIEWLRECTESYHLECHHNDTVDVYPLLQHAHCRPSQLKQPCSHINSIE